MEILRATPAQAADASVLLDEYYLDAGVLQRDTPETVHQLLSSPDGGLWLAYVEGVPAGCVVLRPLESIEQAGECKRLYVRPQFRRRGIAEGLLDAMEIYARSLSWGIVYLDSKDDLRAAIALYLHRGYQRCERYNDNPQATVFLRKSLV